MTIKFTIIGKLDGLNEYTKKNRSNAYAGAKMKKDNEKIVIYYIRKSKLKKVKQYPITLRITWYEKDRRKDIDNITFATKSIQDALVKEGILIDDSQKYINKVEHIVLVDKENPRIEVELLNME